MTRAGTFAFSRFGELRLARPGAEPLRVTGYTFDLGRKAASGDEHPRGNTLRELVAIRSVRGRKR